jgi:multidrug efflux pump subunit AcrB
MADLFIRRPIVAIVISILIVLFGLITLRGLAIEEYPNVAPPQIQVQANYPGADAQTVEESVATPLEQSINGVENMIYMKSSTPATAACSSTSLRGRHGPRHREHAHPEPRRAGAGAAAAGGDPRRA